ncbi:MAG: DUF4838 domain-containing protein [Planctomycetota bacterium]|jgi:hypothetical protein
MRSPTLLLQAATGAWIAAAAVASARADEIVLADNGRSDYRIVVADDASPSTRHGAQELQAFLGEMGGAKLPIVADTEPVAEREILLGNNARLRNLELNVDFDELGHEGYVIRTIGKRLVIAGGDLRGTMYGVYGLLEDHLGCRWFAPGVSRIPKHKRLAVGPVDDKQIPALEYREPFTYDCFDGDWCARNRVNSSSGRLEAKHGGKVRFGGGFFVHTFNRLVPPDKYFDDHPEYFSLVKGKRLKERSQLCCTHDDVIRICTEGILEAMRAQPDAFVFSVSQNDWHNYCECETCQELAKREDSQIAPVLHLVNRVAETVEKEFPEKAVETLAYQWTRRPPKAMRPRPNVIVRLCSIECCFSHPLATCDGEANQKFRDDIRRWAKVSNRLWVWDYVTDFRHYLLPFPNQRVRNDNIRFFVKNNVKGIFEQDTYNTPHSELAALGGYVTAKLLWNPHYDEDKAVDEFLEGYYGKAAQPIRNYIDALHDRVERENVHVNIWVPPTHDHLTDELLVHADKLWQQAEDLTAERADVLRRVKLSRMSIDYAIVERARAAAAKEQLDESLLGPLAARRFEPFVDTLQSCDLTRIMEWQTVDKADYRKKLAAALGLSP